MSLLSSIIDPKTRIGKVIVFLAVLILPMIAISGTLEVYSNVRHSALFPPRSRTPYRFSYSVTIDVEDPVPYTIYLPTLVREDERGPVQEMLDIEFREGNGEVNLIETEKGHALRIESADSIELYFSNTLDEMEVPPIPGPNMTMMLSDGDSEASYYGYLGSETDDFEAELSLRYEVDYRSSDIEEFCVVNIDERLVIGWNVLEGRYYPP